MSPALLIREGRPDDIAGVTAIYADAVLNGTGTFEIEPPSIDEMSRRYERIVSGGYPFIVAVSESDILGYAYAFAYRDRPAYRYTVEDSVYVRADQQGKGLGHSLLAHLLEQAAAAGFRQMIAVIGDSANKGSIRLHERAGFTHAGRLDASGWKAGCWLDVVLMQCALGDGAATPPAVQRLT